MSEIKEKISKRVSFTKENYKRVKIAIETFEIDKKETEAANEVVNNAIEYYFKERVVSQLMNSENE